MKNITSTTQRTAENILTEAQNFGRGKKGNGYHDEFYKISAKDMQILLDAGAELSYFNKPTKKHLEEEKYDHLAIYGDHNFSLNTDKKIDLEQEKGITGGEW